MVNFDAIQPGDIIRVEYVVQKKDIESKQLWGFNFHPEDRSHLVHSSWFKLESVKEHIPTPIEPGNFVVLELQKTPGEVVAIKDDFAWVDYGPNTTGYERHQLLPLKSLKRVAKPK